MKRALASASMASVCLAFVGASHADPLHKHGSEGAWRHEQSGWIFPAAVSGLSRVGPPYTLDGSNDVGAEYAAPASRPAGERRSVFIEVHHADSAMSGSTLETADAPSDAETAFDVRRHPELAGRKSVFTSAEGEPEARSILYFIQSADWVVTLRAVAPPRDPEAEAALDELVQSLPWDTLDSDPGDLHSAGS